MPSLMIDSDLAAAQAALADAAVFDVSDRTQIEMLGADRHSFLHNFCTNDIKGLSIGRGCEAFVCNIKGRILGHIFIFAGPESLWVESTPQQAETLLPHLRRYHLLENLELHDRTTTFGELFLSGPRAVAALESLGVSATNLAEWQHSDATMSLAGTSVRLTFKRVDLFKVPGFLVSGTRPDIELIRQALLSTGVSEGSADAFESLRIGAGLPLIGVDLSDENLAQEAMRTRQAISFNKGCYLGQEPIARLNAMGHVNKQLCRVQFETSSPLVAPQRLVSTSDPAKEIGVITSIGYSTETQQPIGLGIIRSAFAASGTLIQTQSAPSLVVRVL